MIWSIVTGTPGQWKTLTGSGASPGAFKIAWVPKITLSSDGRATETPSVTRILTSWRRLVQPPEEGEVQEDAERRPEHERWTGCAAGTIGQLCWVFR